MKKLAYVFWAVVAVIGLALVMTIVTAVKNRNVQKALEESSPGIPMPAMPGQPAQPNVPQPQQPPSVPQPKEPPAGVPAPATEPAR